MNLEQWINIRFCVKIDKSDHKEVHYKLIAQGRTMNQQCYLEVLKKLQESIWRKRIRILA
jgi:hypothetical protein